ncbi:MAG: hypothetical protein AAGA66_15395, partial [Bacteroidota bacterium]
LDGNLISYYENGDLETKGRMKEGKPFGKYESYYSNGNPFIMSESIGNGIHYLYDSLRTDSLKILYENFDPIDTLEW